MSTKENLEKLKEERKLERIYLRISLKDKALLSALSQINGVTMSEYVMGLIREDATKNKKELNLALKP